MAGLPQVTVVGTLVHDIELRFTQGGVAVASFTIASNDRKFDSSTKKWTDGEATFLRCTLWRQAAENASEGLTRGARVIATGQLRQRSYENREGVKQTVFELDVDELGASVKWAVVKVQKADRPESGGAKPPADDPWGSAPASSGGFADEPPF